MLANSRSAVLKLKIIFKLHLDCFVACETWFCDKHSQDFASINRYSTFRSDRQGRIGGGVDIRSNNYLSPIEIIIANKP